MPYDVHFVKQIIELDNDHYDRCLFEQCILIRRLRRSTVTNSQFAGCFYEGAGWPWGDDRIANTMTQQNLTFKGVK